ncbi:MAG: AMP-binding protein [Novosphingobium sp.]|nr:AMP-binding protein [Novosphingobium sp.]
MTIAAHSVPAELIQCWRELGLWEDISLGAAMARAARAHPGALLHVHAAVGAREATLAQIHADGLELAGSFHALGLRAGDVVAMQLPNCLENAVLFQAVAALGATLLPIVHIFGPAELGQILADSGAKALVVPGRWRSIDFLDRLARLPDLPALRHTIVIGDTAPQGMLRWADLPRGDRPDVAIDPGAAAMLLYTSGTSAAPKGVVHTSRSLLAELNAPLGGKAPGGAWLGPWPSGHIAGSLNILGHALLGRPMVVLESWDAAAAAELIERFAVEQTSGTPFHLSGLLEAATAGGHDLSSLRQFLIGATIVPPSVVAASEAAGIRCCRCYGSTELPTLSQCEPDDPLDKRLNSDGRLNPGCELRIVDDAGADLPAGSEGELAVRGPERFSQYTDAALNAASFLPGGWFLTGDIGRIDADGFLAITDRKKDIIIRGGENISSREVEELLLQMPGVRDAAAIGWPDDRMGERVCAVLIAEPAAAVTIEAIGEVFRRLGVARYKTPEKLVFLDEFPRTPSGKVKKADLRRELSALQGELDRETQP